MRVHLLPAGGLLVGWFSELSSSGVGMVSMSWSSCFCEGVERVEGMVGSVVVSSSSLSESKMGLTMSCSLRGDGEIIWLGRKLSLKSLGYGQSCSCSDVRDCYAYLFLVFTRKRDNIGRGSHFGRAIIASVKGIELFRRCLVFMRLSDVGYNQRFSSGTHLSSSILTTKISAFYVSLKQQPRKSSLSTK